jgi:hypothetical protein
VVLEPVGDNDPNAAPALSIPVNLRINR